MISSFSAFRTNEALCQLSYEAPYLGPEGGNPGGPTQAGRQTDFKFKISPHKQKFIAKCFFGRKMHPLTSGAICLSTPKHNGKSGTVSRLCSDMRIKCCHD